MEGSWELEGSYVGLAVVAAELEYALAALEQGVDNTLADGTELDN